MTVEEIAICNTGLDTPPFSLMRIQQAICREVLRIGALTRILQALNAMRTYLYCNFEVCKHTKANCNVVL